MLALDRHTLFLTLAGSHAHGTARRGSDVDLRGVCIAPLALRLSLFQTFEQYEGPLPNVLGEQVLTQLRVHPTASQSLEVKTESVIFDVAKFLQLCAAANPNALEILFADESDWLYATAAWRRLHALRHRFLTAKVQQTFLGYALAQLKRIKSHRSWLLSPPARKPEREDFGLPTNLGTLSRDDQDRIEQSVAEKIRDYGIDDIDMPKTARIALKERLETLWMDHLATSEGELEERLRAVATHALDLPVGVVQTLNAEKRYRSALKQWHSYQTWQTQRNSARSELERRHGYDTKHAMHLIRLMRMGVEVLATGDLRVRRPDAEELLSIRDGALSYEQLLEATDRLQTEMSAATSLATLPDDVDPAFVDALLLELALDIESL